MRLLQNKLFEELIFFLQEVYFCFLILSIENLKAEYSKLFVIYLLLMIIFLEATLS